MSKKIHNMPIDYDPHDKSAYYRDNLMFVQDGYNITEFDTLTEVIKFLELGVLAFDDFLKTSVCYKIDVQKLNSFFDKHIFLSMTRPTFNHVDDEVLDEYNNHYANVYGLFSTLFYFCFCQSFHPDELYHLTKAQRLSVFLSRENAGIPQYLQLVKVMQYDQFFNYVPRKTTKPTLLEQRFGIPPGYTKYITKRDIELTNHIRFKDLTTLLSIVFYHLYETDAKFSVCKNCDRYFLVKTKRNPMYCDFKAPNSSKTCQQLMASAHFKERNKDNKPYNIFMLYYKRYRERTKVGTISEDAFKKWNLAACAFRDKCIDKKASAEDFEKWCFESFPNRVKKKK